MSEGIKGRVYRAVLDAKGLRYDPPSLAPQGQVKEALAITDAVVLSLRLADDEGAVRAVADAFEHGAAKYDPVAMRMTVDFTALLAALDRYLSGEQGDG